MKLPESLTTVTAFSKSVALVLLFVLPTLGFYLGMDYQRSISIQVSPVSNTQVDNKIKTTPTITLTPTITSTPSATVKPKEAKVLTFIENLKDAYGKTIKRERIDYSDTYGTWDRYTYTNVYKYDPSNEVLIESKLTSTFKVNFPSNWSYDGGTYWDGNKKKIADIVGVVNTSDNVSCSSLFGKNSLSIENKSIDIKEVTIISSELFNESGYWYSHNYCIKKLNTVYSMIFYEKELNKADKVLFEKIIESVEF